jgi:phage terminase large subunit GpA-like protein
MMLGHEVLATTRAAVRALVPPPRLRLSEWIEANIRLPEGVSALPGPLRLWPYQRDIADAIADPLMERITLVKPVRMGFTTLLTGAVGHFVANDPAPILALLPTESDARDYMVSDIEPLFAASPALACMLGDDADEAGRNTLLHRRFPGGSLKLVAARAPRNLRRRSAELRRAGKFNEAAAVADAARAAEARRIEFERLTNAPSADVAALAAKIVEAGNRARGIGIADAPVDQFGQPLPADSLAAKIVNIGRQLRAKRDG